MWEEKLKCDTCQFAGLFHCGHPQNWVKPFFEYCDLYKEGKSRVKIDELYVCSSCKKIFNINAMVSLGKGSKLLCKECAKNIWEGYNTWDPD